MEQEIKAIIGRAIEDETYICKEKIKKIENIVFNKLQMGGDWTQIGNSSIYYETANNVSLYTAYFNCKITILEKTKSQEYSFNGHGNVSGLIQNESGKLILTETSDVYIDKGL